MESDLFRLPPHPKSITWQADCLPNLTKQLYVILGLPLYSQTEITCQRSPGACDSSSQAVARVFVCLFFVS